ncbi:hypothetical protein QE152_g22787 [Popillia japonica]|uniref:Uncharacterized protein n=1 Tax=Popillia japonica TaxID=7064 RepID=A0AAW1KJ56_POPJA
MSAPGTPPRPGETLRSPPPRPESNAAGNESPSRPIAQIPSTETGKSSVKNGKFSILKALEKWLDQVIDKLNVRHYNTAARGNGRRYEKRGEKGSYRRGANRAHLYKIAQSMYRNNRSRLAEHILDGKPLDSAQSLPPIENIQARYTEIFSTESPIDDHPIVDYVDHTFDTYLYCRLRRSHVRHVPAVYRARDNERTW